MAHEQKTGDYVFTSRIDEAMSDIDNRLRTAATAMGEQAVGMVVDQMDFGYATPIRDTSTLIQHINSEVDEQGEHQVSVIVGTNIKYAPYVYYGFQQKAGLPFQDRDGNWHRTKGGHIAGRPFFADAMAKGKDRLQQIFEAFMKGGND